MKPEDVLRRFDEEIGEAIADALGEELGNSPRIVELTKACMADVTPMLADLVRQVRERVAAELREDADAHRRVVARKPTEYDEARLARARTLDDAASRITRMRGES